MDVGKASRIGLSRQKREGSRDRKVFTRTSGRTRKENVSSNPMRGGIRL